MASSNYQNRQKECPSSFKVARALDVNQREISQVVIYYHFWSGQTGIFANHGQLTSGRFDRIVKIG